MKFYKMWPEVPSPTRAQISLSGQIPARAYQHCEPFLVANGMGWLLYPPLDFSLYWTGTELLFQSGTSDEWVLVEEIFLPDSARYWLDKFDPQDEFLFPNFIEVFPERGVIQLWTGLFAESEPGKSTWVRDPINQYKSDDYNTLEGIVETDWWAGPLFTNLEIKKTDKPIVFRKSRPFLQVFSITKSDHHKLQKEAEIFNFEDNVPCEYLAKMRETSIRRNTQKPGSYRKAARKGGANGE